MMYLYRQISDKLITLSLCNFYQLYVSFYEIFNYLLIHENILLQIICVSTYTRNVNTMEMVLF